MIECIPGHLPEDEKDKLRALAFKEMQAMSVSSESIWSDIDNLVFIFWLAIKPEQPTVTLEEVGRIVDEPGNIERLVSAINDIKGDGAGVVSEKKS